MNTRKEDIKTLQEMQKIQSKIQEIENRLVKLYNDETNSIDPYLYNTHHADDCDREKSKKLFQADDEYREKVRHACQFKIIPWIGIIVGIIVGGVIPGIIGTTDENLYTAMVLSGILVGISGFVIKKVLNFSINKHQSKMYEKECRQINNEYKTKLEQALEDDKKEKRRYENDLKIARERRHEENRPEREKLEAEIEEYENKFEEIQIISDDDIDNIPTLIKILESNRADNIKEALREMDEQNRRIEEEKRRKAEEEKRRKAEEAARLATMPGKVHIRIGSINTYSGNLQTVRNSIYFDGAHYGAGDATGNTVFQLSPGPHNVYAQLQEAGYIFTSPTQSFILPGNGDVYVKIMIKNARANIYLCHSMSELLET